MFTSTRIEHTGSYIEYRIEKLTGFRTRICPERLKRGIGSVSLPTYPDDGCPFCPDRIEEATPVFADGTRIRVGESLTFPNLYPYAVYHVVTAITRAHSVQRFTTKQIVDALKGQITALENQEGYVSINWNFLPSAGASLAHPHLQGLCDSTPDTMPARYFTAGLPYFQSYGTNYFNDMKEYAEQSESDLPGTSLFWYAHPVPIGEREIRCILPFTKIHEFHQVLGDFASDLVMILEFYRELGTSAFNMAIFFAHQESRDHVSAFCSLISRINPNPQSTSDTAFMERLHLEPVILTLPEELASIW
ncbi:MAG: galactose-1-phosphate uridylyltransferase, partial [Methanospirillum sp.]|uniref:galactose-1-phosphate uridylyltransferase n=1 Tax=Methanospirillum sp. TaxID=45200 RepID=UPI00237512EA